MSLSLPLQYAPNGFHSPVPSSESETILQIIIFGPLVLFGIYLFVLIIIAGMRPPKDLLNHWNVLMYDVKMSSMTFYQDLADALKEHDVESLTCVTKDIAVGNVFSHKRKYLRVTYRGFTYDICGAPFGNAFFVSYWMYREMPVGEFLVRHLPFGKRFHRVFFPVTYYVVDTSNMFHTLMHDVMMDMVDRMAKDQKLEKLSAHQKIPVMKDVFKR